MVCQVYVRFQKQGSKLQSNFSKQLNVHKLNIGILIKPNLKLMIIALTQNNSNLYVEAWKRIKVERVWDGCGCGRLVDGLHEHREKTTMTLALFGTSLSYVNG